MKKIIGITEFSLPKTVVVLGNFDGIHKGHRFLLNKAKEIASEKKIKTALYNFVIHPSFVIMHKEPVDLIYVSEEKMTVIDELGIDYYIEYPFNKEFADYEPEDFIKNIVVDKLNADTIIVGEDYRFGKKRLGNVELLKELSIKYNYNVMSMPKLKYKDREISSTWVREEIKAGNMKMVSELTGKKFFFIGVVEGGKRIGRTIGFPTANISPKKGKILPPNGVYITKIYFHNKEYYGITNVGKKPTVQGDRVNVETHILNFEGDIYGETILVEFFNFIRPEKKFLNLDDLMKQIEEDIKVLEKYFLITEL